MTKNVKEINPIEAIRNSLVSREGESLFDTESKKFRNPIYGIEMFLPDCYGTDKSIIRQLLGNFGAYASSLFSSDVDAVMVDDRIADKIESGDSDSEINKLCDVVGQSAGTLLFVRESWFIAWAKDRVSKSPDKSSKELLNLIGDDENNVDKKVSDLSYIESSPIGSIDDSYEQFELF